MALLGRFADLWPFLSLAVVIVIAGIVKLISGSFRIENVSLRYGQL